MKIQWSILLSLFLALICAISPAQAQMVSTEEAATEHTTPSDREKVKAFLERSSVQERLQAMGVQGVLAKARVEAMTDQEVAQLAQKIDAMPAGAALSNNDLVVVLLVALLVVLLL